MIVHINVPRLKINISVITVSDLKDIILNPENTSDRIKKIESLKKKINTIVEDTIVL